MARRAPVGPGDLIAILGGAAIGMGLFLLSRRYTPQVNDVVAVRRDVLLQRANVPPEIMALIPPTVQKIAVRVSGGIGREISGSVVGWIEPATNVPSEPPVAGPLVTITRADITDIYRGGKRLA